jgi:hypothetical protein
MKDPTTPSHAVNQTLAPKMFVLVPIGKYPVFRTGYKLEVQIC